MLPLHLSLTGISPNKILAHLIPYWRLILRGLGIAHSHLHKERELYTSVLRMEILGLPVIYVDSC